MSFIMHIREYPANFCFTFRLFSIFRQVFYFMWKLFNLFALKVTYFSECLSNIPIYITKFVAHSRLFHQSRLTHFFV